MRRNCNLELQLFPFSNPDQSSCKTQHQQEQQQLTIFYNGSVCVCDVTEFQAKAILSLASKEMEDKLRTTPTGSSRSASPTLPSPVYSPNNGLSMKRSLQRFLQKRNHRIQATYPYNINGHATSCGVDH